MPSDESQRPDLSSKNAMSSQVLGLCRLCMLGKKRESGTGQALYVNDYGKCQWGYKYSLECSEGHALQDHGILFGGWGACGSGAARRRLDMRAHHGALHRCRSDALYPNHLFASSF